MRSTRHDEWDQSESAVHSAYSFFAFKPSEVMVQQTREIVNIYKKYKYSIDYQLSWTDLFQSIVDGEPRHHCLAGVTSRIGKINCRRARTASCSATCDKKTDMPRYRAAIILNKITWGLDDSSEGFLGMQDGPQPIRARPQVSWSGSRGWWMLHSTLTIHTKRHHKSDDDAREYRNDASDNLLID